MFHQYQKLNKNHPKELFKKPINGFDPKHFANSLSNELNNALLPATSQELELYDKINNKNSDDKLIELTESTKKTLEDRLLTKDNTVVSTTDISKTFVKYTPKTPLLSDNFGKPIKEKIICISDVPIDPLLPSKFKHRKMQKDIEDPKVPVLHSPSKKLTTEEVKAWNVPPCISNYKNAKGYTIPMHMRLTADMRSSKDIQLSDKFAKFSDVINLTEKQFRKEIEERNKVKDCMQIMDNIKKEQELLQVAEEAKRQKQKLINSSISNLSFDSKTDNRSVNTSHYSKLSKITDDTSHLLGRKRSELKSINTLEEDSHLENFSEKRNSNFKIDSELEERNLLRERAKRMIKKEIMMGGNTKEINSQTGFVSNLIKKQETGITNNKDSLQQYSKIDNKGISGNNIPSSNELIIDSRLYNKTSGLDSGFKDDDEYDLYDKPLFNDYSKIKSSNSNYKSLNSTYDDSIDAKASKSILEKIKERTKMFEKK